jgi:hypothetical protein
MFAPNQLKVASEMLRVCRPGGSIGMANWTPEGFVGQLFETLGKHVAPPHGVNSPATWGRKAWIDEVFADKARSIAFDIRAFVFRHNSPEHFVDFFRTYYGPVHRTFLALDADGQQALADELHAKIAQFNTAKDGSMRVPSDYAEIIIIKA